MKHIAMDDYWERLTDYYYDNVHFEHPSPKFCTAWVEETFNCIVDKEKRCISFKSDLDLTKFLFKWM